MGRNFSQIPPQVIVVDDEPELVEIYKKSFESFGWSVDSGTNGSEADYKISHKEFDVILTDLNMPYTDGLQFVKNIRENKTNRNTLIVVVSGFLSKNAIVKLAQYNVNKIYTKPLDIEEITGFICETIGCPVPEMNKLKDDEPPPEEQPAASVLDEDDDEEMEVAS